MERICVVPFSRHAGRTMKGILDIEFAVSLFVFLVVLSFVTISIVGTIPLLREQALTDDIRSKAWQLSELLVFDTGEPSSWTIETVRRIGLSNGTRYGIDSTKITRLRTLCDGRDGYLRVKELLTVSVRNDIMITITEGGASFRCAPPAISSIAPTAVVTRYGTSGLGAVAVEVAVL